MTWKAFFTWNWILAGAFLLLALMCLFWPGYSFSALVFGGLGAITVAFSLLRLLGRQYPVLARWLTRSLTALVCLGAILVGATLCLVVRASWGDPEKSCDYLVVLGAKVRADGPSLSLRDRILAAYDYMEAHPDVTVVVSGGRGPDEPMSEAQCMFQELVDLGADPQRILVEDQSTSTWENLKFSLRRIEEATGDRPGTLGIVSSEYHLYRAGLLAGHFGVDPVGVPAKTEILPLRLNNFLREVAGVWHYLLLGGQYRD